MSNCRQSDRSFSCANSHFLLQYGIYTVKRRRSWNLSRPLLLFKLNIKAIQSKQGHIWFFQDHLDSFQDHCFYYCKLNIFASIWFKSSQNKVQPLNFKFSNSIMPIVAIVVPYEQIWQSAKNTHNPS